MLINFHTSTSFLDSSDNFDNNDSVGLERNAEDRRSVSLAPSKDCTEAVLRLSWSQLLVCVSLSYAVPKFSFLGGGERVNAY
jgi:hypothetical protein